MKITRQELGKKSKAQLSALFKQASLISTKQSGPAFADVQSILRQIKEEPQRRTPGP